MYCRKQHIIIHSLLIVQALRYLTKVIGHRAGAGVGGLAGQVRLSYAESRAKVMGIGTIGECGRRNCPHSVPLFGQDVMEQW